MMRDYVYMDNAASSFPKPDSVSREVYRCLTEYSGNPGRSSHPISIQSAAKIYECREQISELLNATPESVIFTHNATTAINMVMKCAIGHGEHFIISNMEHNAVYRPAIALNEQVGATFDTFDAFAPSEQLLRNIENKITPQTRAIVCTHASNICPLVLPIEQLGELCRRRGIFFILDAAQSAGREDICMKTQNVDALIMAGHKGLLAPMGVGVLVLSERLQQYLAARPTLIEGGSGIDSLGLKMPNFFPERFEAGTPSLPAIAGLCEGVKFIRNITPQAIRESEDYHYRRMREILLNTRNVTLYKPEYTNGSVLLFNIDGMESEHTASLFAEHGVYLRAGLHCAPLAHERLGTLAHGAVRASLGWATSSHDVETFARALTEIAK